VRKFSFLIPCLLIFLPLKAKADIVEGYVPVNSAQFMTKSSATATYIPYSGANANVNLGTHTVTASTASFSNLSITSLNCSTNTNSGKLTTAGGQVFCADDISGGGGGSAVNPSTGPWTFPYLVTGSTFTTNGGYIGAWMQSSSATFKTPSSTITIETNGTDASEAEIKMYSGTQFFGSFISGPFIKLCDQNGNNCTVLNQTGLSFPGTASGAQVSGLGTLSFIDSSNQTTAWIDAPSDGSTYGRNNGGWAVAGGASTNTLTHITTPSQTGLSSSQSGSTTTITLSNNLPGGSTSYLNIPSTGAISAPNGVSSTTGTFKSTVTIDSISSEYNAGTLFGVKGFGAFISPSIGVNGGVFIDPTDDSSGGIIRTQGDDSVNSGQGGGIESWEVDDFKNGELKFAHTQVGERGTREGYLDAGTTVYLRSGGDDMAQVNLVASTNAVVSQRVVVSTNGFASKQGVYWILPSTIGYSNRYQVLSATGTNGQVVVSSVTEQKDWVIVGSSNVVTTTDTIKVMTVEADNYPRGITITKIRMTTNANSTCTEILQKRTTPSAQGTLIGTVSTSGSDEATQTSITNPTLNAGDYIFHKMDGCTDPALGMTVWFYVN